MPWIVLASLGAHLLILGGLVAGVQIMPPLDEPPVLSVELLRPAPPVPPELETAQPPQAAATRSVAPMPARVSPSPFVAPAPAPPAVAKVPPGFKANGLTGGGEALRQTARDAVGCRSGDLLALTRAERSACAETLGEKNKNRPAMYAVIDPDKKAAFDGACKKDDDWCLYRAGKGPYPGILALGRKKKRDDW
ncbi:MAG: hypothetical protein B7Z44_02955 [Caulobacter sp. 12-67-6]|nr:MAG: hypothetical protein B7Z44_02955 [Caulobacter sp. 12-67-6]